MILQENFPFVRDDLFLVAWIDTDTGKQKLIMEQRDPKTNESILHDEVECIHTAVIDIPTRKFPQVTQDPRFVEKILQIRTSETLQEIPLVWQEKFRVLKSWIAGIAEAGTGAFRLQAEIESAGHLMYPVSWKLLRFLARAEPDLIMEYLDEIGQHCMHEGVLHESCLIANLIPVLDMMLTDLGRFISESSTDNLLQLETADLEKYRPIVATMFELNPPLKLFLHKPPYAVFLTFPEAADIPDFPSLFFHESSFLRKALLLNPRVTSFPEFSIFLSSRTEPDAKVRALAAHNSRAPNFPEFRNFLSISTENSTEVRCIAARHPGAPQFPEYVNFLSHKTEPRVKVRKVAAAHMGAPKHAEFKNYLSYKTEPEARVRVIAAQNSNAQILPEFQNFLSDDSEPNTHVRIMATRHCQLTGKKPSNDNP